MGVASPPGHSAAGWGHKATRTRHGTPLASGGLQGPRGTQAFAVQDTNHPIWHQCGVVDAEVALRHLITIPPLLTIPDTCWFEDMNVTEGGTPKSRQGHRAGLHVRGAFPPQGE